MGGGEGGGGEGGGGVGGGGVGGGGLGGGGLGGGEGGGGDGGGDGGGANHSFRYITPSVVLMMVAGLLELASGPRKSTSIGSLAGEKNFRVPSTLPHPAGSVAMPKLRVSASLLGTSTAQSPPASVYRPSVSKQYSDWDEKDPSQRFCTFCLLKVSDNDVKPPSGIGICITSPPACEVIRSGRMLTRHFASSLQV